MAYARYGRRCDWYVFWEADSATPDALRSTQRLAVWHCEHRRKFPSFTYVEVRAMLASDDFAPVPGYSRESHDDLHAWLSEFVSDVEAEYSA